jgi:hypothetical protein
LIFGCLLNGDVVCRLPQKQYVLKVDNFCNFKKRKR